MTVSIDPITCYINEGILTQEPSKNMIKSKIISIQAYKGDEVTFQILIDDNHLYSNIKISDIYLNNFGVTLYTRNRYNKCPKYEIDVYEIDYLKDMDCRIFTGLKNEIDLIGKYILSIDFYTDNEQLHLIKSEGRLHLIPNHKISWKCDSTLPTNYKKL